MLFFIKIGWYFWFGFFVLSVALQAQTAPKDTSILQNRDSLDAERNKPLADTTQVHYLQPEMLHFEHPSIGITKIENELRGFESVQIFASAQGFLSDAYAKTGGLGTAFLTNFQQTSTTALKGQGLGLNAYEPYRLRPEQMAWYRIENRRPFTDLYYSQINQKNVYIRAVFAHEVSPRFYYGIQYNLINALGYFARARVRNQNIGVNLRWLSANRKYIGYFTGTNNVYTNQESGGLEADSVSGQPSFALINLPILLGTKAQNQSWVTHLQYAHYFGAKGADSNLVAGQGWRFGHIAEYEKLVYKYFDTDPNSAQTDYYRFFDINTAGLRHYLTRNRLANTLLAKYAQKWGGAQAKLFHYWDKYNQEPQVFVQQTLGGQVNLQYKLGAETANNQLVANANMGAAYTTNGRFDHLINVGVDWRIKYLHLNASATSEQYQPALIATQIFVNQRNLWANPNLAQIRKSSTRLSAQILPTRTTLKAGISTCQNYLYSDTSFKIQAYAGNLQILETSLQQNFEFWKFSTAHTVSYQKVIAGADVYRLPEWETTHSLAWEGWVFKTMRLRTGVNLRWWSAYYANGYFPLTQQFFVQNQTKISIRPNLDYFINVRIWQARIFVCAENLNQLIYQKNNFLLFGYAQPNFLVRLGVSWKLFD